MAKIDFRSPQCYIEYDGKPLDEAFGGPSPRGWLSSVEVVVEYGLTTAMTVVLEPPRKDAIAIINNNIDLLKSRKNFVVKFGYYPSLWSPLFTGIARTPSVDWSVDGMSITFEVHSGKTLLYNTRNMEYRNKSLYEIVNKLFTDGGYTVAKRADPYTEIEETKKDLGKSSNNVYIVDGKGDLSLNKIILPSASVTGESDWNYMRRMLEEFGYTVVDTGGGIIIQHLSEISTSKPVAKFVLFGNIDVENNVFPMEGFNSEAEFRVLGLNNVKTEATNKDTGKSEKHEGSDDNSAQKSGQKETSTAKEAAPKTDSTSISGPAGKQQKQAMQGENDNKSVQGGATIECIGIPFILPGRNIEISTGVKFFDDGVWQVMKTTHTFDTSGYNLGVEIRRMGTDKAGQNKQKVDAGGKIVNAKNGVK